MSNCELSHALLTRLVSYRSFPIPQLFQPTSSICKLYLPKNIRHRLGSFFSYVWSLHNHIALLGTCSQPTEPSHACNLHDCIKNSFNKYTKCISSTYSCRFSDLIHLWQYIFNFNLQSQVQSRQVWLLFCHGCLQPSSVNHHICYQHPVIRQNTHHILCQENKL